MKIEITEISSGESPEDLENHLKQELRLIGVTDVRVVNKEPVMEICPVCNGHGSYCVHMDGQVEDEYVECDWCEGTGRGPTRSRLRAPK